MIFLPDGVIIYCRKAGIRMDQVVTAERALNNAVASVEMEGFHVSEETKKLCMQVLNGQMDYATYLTLAKQDRKSVV